MQALSRLRRSLELRPGEGTSVLWAAAMFFCVLASYYVLRPVRDALVLDGDPAFIPWLFGATLLLMLAVAGPWGSMVARWPRHRLVPRAYRLFAVQILAFAALLAADIAPGLVGKAFYVWTSMFNLFVVSVFWSLCADLASPEKGRRLFGLITAGGTLGALTGPSLTRALALHVDTAWLLVISAGLIELATWCASRFSATAEPERRPAAAEPGLGGSAWAGLTRMTRSPTLAAIAAYVLCSACLATFVYLQQAAITKAALPDRATRTAFFAEIELWTLLLTLLLQLGLTARLLRVFGAGLVLTALPLVQGIGVLALTAEPSLAMTAAVSATSRAATHGLSRPTRELLFTALPREDKYKTKNVIDTLVYRFGDFASAWLVSGLGYLGVSIGFVALPLTLAFGALALALGAGHRRRVSHLRSEPPTVARDELHS